MQSKIGLTTTQLSEIIVLVIMQVVLRKGVKYCTFNVNITVN